MGVSSSMIGALLVLLLGSPQHDHAQMEHRGNVAMGFAQTATTHTFRLFTDGGAIEVRANDPKDAKSVEDIRAHLRTIAKAFAEGDFAKPELTHDQLPDGAKEMKELRAAIHYRFNELPAGGRVRIKTKDGRALEAIHRFLKFQIDEHKTDNSKDIQAE